MQRLIKEERILWPASPTGRPREKKFMNALQSSVTGFSTWLGSDDVGFNYTATREVRQLFGTKVFDFPKPVSLIAQLCSQVTQSTDVVLDFFAGSASTAHAVMAQNARDGGRRSFILVQLGEPVDPESEAGRAGFATIAEMAKERIRRAGVEIVEGGPLLAGELDVGFRSFKIDTTNKADVLRTPDGTEQSELTLYTDSLKGDRTGDDLLFQVLLDWGLELAMPIRSEVVYGQEVHVVESGALIACFADDVSDKVVNAIADRKPLRAVFRDSGFTKDADRINAEQVFAERSPSTDVKTI